LSSPAERAAEILYDQLVAKRADALMGLFDNPEFAAGEGAGFEAIAARVREMTPDDRQVIAAAIRRSAADTLLNMLGIINGSYGLAGVDGHWALCLDGQDVGGEVFDTVLNREDGAA
jgi:hypothetical protein